LHLNNRGVGENGCQRIDNYRDHGIAFLVLYSKAKLNFSRRI
jgi:hypothetical protein